MEVGIIGLGKFGMRLGQSLMELGHIVIGIDCDANKVQQADEYLSQAYEADCTDINALSDLKLHKLDTVAVTIGNKLEASLLIVLGLQELGAPNILVKASTPMHKKVLERMGVANIVQPEIDAAVQTALKMDNPGLVDLLPIGAGVVVQEAMVDNWAGKNLVELKVRGTSNILVAAVRENGEEAYRFVPDPRRRLEKGDALLLIGYRRDMRKALGKI